MSNIIQKITDVATIVFPAIIAVLGIFNLTGAVQITGQVEQVLFIILGALSSIASVLFNQLNKEKESK